MTYRPEWNCDECHGEPVGPFECICVTRQKIAAQNDEASRAEFVEQLKKVKIA